MRAFSCCQGEETAIFTHEVTHDSSASSTSEGNVYFTHWKRQPWDHFQRILLSSYLISEHKCNALRDVIKLCLGDLEMKLFSDNWILHFILFSANSCRSLFTDIEYNRF
ncbi:hypothetical protein Ancab_022418 [Ancistrocladus abbreviatus]